MNIYDNGGVGIEMISATWRMLSSLSLNEFRNDGELPIEGAREGLRSGGIDRRVAM